MWKRVVDAELAGPDVAWEEFRYADDDVEIAEPCTDEGIVREVQALHDSNASGDEDDGDDMESPPEIVSVSTALSYIASLKELVCRRDMGGDHVAALNRHESAVLSSALQKQMRIINFFFFFEINSKIVLSSLMALFLRCSVITNARI